MELSFMDRIMDPDDVIATHDYVRSNGNVDA